MSDSFMQSENINELAKALAAAQSQIEGAVKDAANPFYKSKYADLAEVWHAIKKPLAAAELAVTQTFFEDDKGTMLETLLMHSSGQWKRSLIRVKPVKDDPQGMGSAISYFRRYALSAMVGVYQVDDDGNAASNIDPHNGTVLPPVPRGTPGPGKVPPYIPPSEQAPVDPTPDFESFEHEHAWRPSQYQKDMDYCTVKPCKEKRKRP